MFGEFIGGILLFAQDDLIRHEARGIPHSKAILRFAGTR